MKIFRWVDPGTLAVRLDMNLKTGIYLGEGADVGGKPVTYKWLSQEGIDGAELASSWHDIVTMTIPLVITPQATAAAMETLINALNVELDRATNAIEMMPDDLTGTSYIMDTYRANQVSMHQGLVRRSPWKVKFAYVAIEVPRKPDMRGRGLIV